ncbi:MAG: hypothetical protein AMJ69_09365 [Gammaproteobacteria bacterium SG8_47]|nr:MAG: hypothetical protein AMJ69_09365 [Gammaproteobacteria bacterium SG8_47]
MFSAISSWALVVARALQSYGCDSDDVFRKAGLDPAKLRDPNARYPVEAMQRLWKLAEDVSADPCFGLSAARYWHPTTFHALGYSWMASHSLRDALERMVRYLRIVTTAAQARLDDTGSVSKFALGASPEAARLLTTRNPEFGQSFSGIDAGLATLVQMCRGVYGEEFAPQRVMTTRERPSCAARMEAFYRCPVEYSAAENALLIDRDQLDQQLPTAHAELARTNDKVVAEYLAHLDRGDVEMQVRVKMVDALPSGELSEQSIADALHLSLRSLQRKLRESGMSYKELLDGTRRELARQYLDDSHYSINEVTYLLGFSEPSNFTRAFKRWYGKSPTAYRAERI